MNIKYLYVQCYKGIKDGVKIELDNINAIVGKNDAGKSTLLYAINSFFNDPKLVQGDRYYGAKEKEETIIEIWFEGEEIQDVPKVLLDKEGFLHIKKCGNSVGENYKTTIICNDFANESYQNAIQMTSSKLKALFSKVELDMPEKLEYENIFWMLDKLIEEETNYIEMEYDIKSAPIKTFLKDVYPQYSLFLADTSLDTGASGFQNQFKKIVTNVIEEHIDDFKNLKQKVTETLENEVTKIQFYMNKHYPEIDNMKPDIAYDWLKLINFDILIKDESEYEVSLSSKGTGIQRLFMVAYFQYLAEKMYDNESSYIFAIEEPETFLHPGAQRILLNSIKQISENHQIILTTHSPVFASEVSNENIIVAAKNEGKSVYQQKSNISAEMIVDELGIRASDTILNSKLLVFVEGSNDARFWKIVYEKFEGIKPREEDVLFMPGGGNELHNIAEMNLMHKINRNFMVIVDKDGGAVDYNEKLKKQEKMKQLVEAKGGELVVLRKREIENYYSADVLKDMLTNVGIIIDELTIGEYEDVQAKIKGIINGRKVNFKIKNNMDIFINMTQEQFKEVCAYDDNGIVVYELEEIVNKIKEKTE